jgi:hypothetical protein
MGVAAATIAHLDRGKPTLVAGGLPCVPPGSDASTGRDTD